MNFFSYLFIIALLAGLALDAWLLWRQMRHVRAHRGAVPEAFRDAIGLDAHQKAADYTIAKGRVARWELPYGLLILLLWLGGGIEWLATLIEAWTVDPIYGGVLLFLGVGLGSALLELPFALYRTFVVEQRFGFNRTTPGRFVADLLLQGGLMVLLGGLLLAAILWVMMTLGSWWWLAGWLIWLLFSLTMMWLYPTLIAPLFNSFEPLQEGELKDRIQHLLSRCGFRGKGLYVMDGSRRSSHGNAYFTGLGRAKRIVFFDTLLKSLAPDEVEAVLAHELGHFRHKHVRNMLLLSSAMMLAGFAVAGWVMLQPWFYQGLGIASTSQAMDLLVLVLVLPVFTRFLQPLMARYQRKHEFQADDFAAAESGARPLIDALVKLYRENAATLTPDPLYSAFHDSHPPAPVRIGRLAASRS